MNHQYNLERFELKYIIPYSMIRHIENYISVYCEKDLFSQRENDAYYTVNSLYLDSKNFGLLGKKKNKVADRFNLRVRSYGDGTAPPYFFEVKCKRGAVVEKLRSKVEDEQWPDFFKYRTDGPNINQNNCGNLNTFFKHALALQAEPKILTQYQRLAYFSTIDDYARVTFDKNLRFQRVSEYTVTPDKEKMCNYDANEALGGPSASVVLELKSYRNVPIWMLDLIKYFGLNQRSFSKYEKSLEESMFDGYNEFFTQVPMPLFL